ncbi:hypothetical protein PHET_10477 [Paragonimus heterotremus]|uniref:Uncharacterized protein n=1 Tax=Paragonimus heterotremus TaxID=100268 RepID=A0A8J4SUM1_9TREM|nr:hypothetical protein PHET_10477 [Paragonimus heterotremus]
MKNGSVLGLSNSLKGASQQTGANQHNLCSPEFGKALRQPLTELLGGRSNSSLELSEVAVDHFDSAENALAASMMPCHADTNNATSLSVDASAAAIGVPIDSAGLRSIEAPNHSPEDLLSSAYYQSLTLAQKSMPAQDNPSAIYLTLPFCSADWRVLRAV